MISLARFPRQPAELYLRLAEKARSYQYNKKFALIFPLAVHPFPTLPGSAIRHNSAGMDAKTHLADREQVFHAEP